MVGGKDLEPIGRRCFVLSDPKVLLLSSDESETHEWEEMFREHATLRIARNLDELQSNLEGDVYDVLFCGWSFHMGTWHDALGQVRLRCPDLPVVIFSRTGGEQEWVKVLAAGAFDLLIPPYQKQTMIPILEQAVASCEARRIHGTGSISCADSLCKSPVTHFRLLNSPADVA